MIAHHYRKLIVRAVCENDTVMLDRLTAALMEAEAAKGILRAKGYGQSGTSIDDIARQVPLVDGR